MTTPTPSPKRILSGVQPSGKLHLGNYFGAIKQHIALQNEGYTFYFIADYHALTTIRDTARAIRDETKKPADPAKMLREYTHDVALDYLALGLDPDRGAFFRQSDVPEVTELAWFLGTVTGMGLLERAVSYKDKVDKGIEASVGLFYYPVLMAADILIYRSHVVPVGKDQVQHVEMTRDMAEKFNRAYAEVFPLPDYRLDQAPYVPGIDGKKMSKSYGNTIEIFMEGSTLKKRVMSIVTDSTPVERPKSRTTTTSISCTACSPRRRKSRFWPSATGPAGWATARSRRCCWTRSAVTSPRPASGASSSLLSRTTSRACCSAERSASAEACKTLACVPPGHGHAAGQRGVKRSLNVPPARPAPRWSGSSARPRAGSGCGRRSARPRC